MDGTVDPARDIEVINLELILADISQIEKRLEKVRIMTHTIYRTYLVFLSFMYY